MIENLYGVYAEITKKRAMIKVREVEREFELPPLQTPVSIEGGVAFTRPFRVNFGVLLTLNGELVLLRLNGERLLDDFNTDLSSITLLLEAFRVLNLQLAVVDEETEDRILIVPENSGEITPYFDAISEMQLNALKKLNPVFKYFGEDFLIAKTGKQFKDKMVRLTITDEGIEDDYIDAIVIPDGSKNVVEIIYPLDVRLDPDDVTFVSLEPLGNPVFISRVSGIKLINGENLSKRVKSVFQTASIGL